MPIAPASSPRSSATGISIRRAPRYGVRSAGACREALVEPWIAGLAAAGRYPELWEYTRASSDPDPGAYYRHALIAALAAAHFDMSKARERLAHEAANAEAYPEQARALLAEFAALVTAEPPAPAARWAALAEHPFLVAPAATNIRFLLHTHALRCEPGREASAAAIAALLEERRFLGTRPAVTPRSPPVSREDRWQSANTCGRLPMRGSPPRRTANAGRRWRSSRRASRPMSFSMGRRRSGSAMRRAQRRSSSAAMAGGGPPAMTWTAKRLLAAARGGAS